ncbi:MAG: histidine kinase, partial [Bacteroidetes bacterium]
ESLKEKISQLALQNTELEKALVQLHEAQDELVKSERLAASGKITAQLSHELNNPIHNIQSCLQSALKRASQGAAERELIEIALEEVQRLAKLTRQTLDVYRVSMVQETKEPTDLNAVIREVVESSAPIFEEHNIRVILNLFNAMPKVSGLHDKLKQVFLNLCINAKDAMPSGGELTIKTLQQDGLAIAVVSDTGIGIPGENINRIYDAFFTTKGKVSGVGLGLSVTYGIIQQHNGTIDVKSTVGEGTTFTLTFPLPGEPHD